MSTLEDALALSAPRSLRDLTVAGLQAPVRIGIDDLGMPTVRAASGADVAVGLGYVTARDRLFQMDVLRRTAGGCLAELLGPAAVAQDLLYRKLGFGQIAPSACERLPPDQAQLVRAYALGVNTAIEEEPTPFEYHLLADRPQPWRATDTMLVAQLMTKLLSLDGQDKLTAHVMGATLPVEVISFFLGPADPYGSDAFGRPAPVAPPPVPAWIRERVRHTRPSLKRPVVGASLAAGSNAWVIDGTRTSSGQAILANDIHLPLAVPNIWYRVCVEAGSTRAHGVVVPGTPVIAAGANGSVAWGLTRLVADTIDLVEVEIDERAGSYSRGTFSEPLRRRQETIRVRGGEPVTLDVWETAWGPVTARAPGGKHLALHWTALSPAGVDLTLGDLTHAKTVEEACDIASRAGGPAMNFVVAGADGRIGWTPTGRIPDRQGAAALGLVTAADQPWSRLIEPGELPRQIGSPTGIIVNANNLTSQHARPEVGVNGFGGERALRIGTVLGGLPIVSEADCVQLQLDLDAGFFRFYADLLLRCIPADSAGDLGHCRAAAQAWDGTSGTGTRGLGVLVLFRELIREMLFAAALEPCLAYDPAFVYSWHNHEAPLRAMIEAELYPPPHGSFAAFVRAVGSQAARLVAIRAGRADVTWGELNRACVRHALSPFAPGLAELADREDLPLPGLAQAVCVAAADFGASLRLVVSPSRLAQARIGMPGEQSGRPGECRAPEFAAWVAGEPMPLAGGTECMACELRPTSTDGSTPGMSSPRTR